jgi:hypothetical protein
MKIIGIEECTSGRTRVMKGGWAVEKVEKRGGGAVQNLAIQVAGW